MEYSGAGEKLINEKNQKQKISWHCPFKNSSTDAESEENMVYMYGILCRSWL